MTVPIVFSRAIFRVTRGDRLTPLEKLGKPFDMATWTTLIGTFAFALSAIFIISFLPKLVRDFVFGSSIHYPAFAFMKIFFGIGLISTPRRNFARFLFMMFTILFLVIRTVYQGKMFDFLQYNIKTPAANSIGEIADRDVPVVFIAPNAFEDDSKLTVNAW